MKKNFTIIILIICLLIVVFIFVIQKGSERNQSKNFDNIYDDMVLDDATARFQQVLENKGNSIDVNILEVDRDKEGLLLSYEVKANESVYIFDPERMHARCANDFKELIVQGNAFYAVVDLNPIITCNAFVDQEQPTLFDLFFLEKGEVMFFRTDITTGFDGAKVDLGFQEIKHISMAIGYLNPLLIESELQKALNQKEVKVIEIGDNKYFQTRSWGWDLQEYAIVDVPF